MAIVAHRHPFVIGVDTHARSHALSIVACPHGEIDGRGGVPGHLLWARPGSVLAARRTVDLHALWAIKGTGTSGPAWPASRSRPDTPSLKHPG